MERLRNLDLNKNRTIGHHRSNIDNSRPFRSVKEAVAIFGEQFPTIHTTTSSSPKPFSLPTKEAPIFSPLENEPPWKHSLSSSSPRKNETLVDTVRKLEAELEQTKAEIKVLKGKGSETEVALASLNAELHRSMSKLAWAEAAEEEMKIGSLLIGRTKSGPLLPSLGQVMSVGEKEGLMIDVGRGKEIKKKLKKPIIPTFGDLFFSSRKKGSTNATDNPLYASSPLHWN